MEAFKKHTGLAAPLNRINVGYRSDYSKAIS